MEIYPSKDGAYPTPPPPDKQPITSVVLSKPGTLLSNHVVPPAHRKLVMTDQHDNNNELGFSQLSQDGG